jgi:hypothetical protein
MARTTRRIDQPRYAEWVRSSKALKPIAPGLALFVEGLGKLDAQLVFEDAATDAHLDMDLTDRLVLSRLWVLGAYEVVRTMSERVRAKPSLLSKRLAERTHRTKRYLERVRIPLAKLEPATRHAATDFAEALPAMHSSLGISWKVANRVFVPRRRMADRLLKLLQALKK